MKTKPYLAAVASLTAYLTGCASIEGTRTAPDGSVLRIKSTRFMWASQNIDFSVTDSNRLTCTLKVDKSSVDSAALAAIAEGAAKGAVSGIKP